MTSWRHLAACLAFGAVVAAVPAAAQDIQNGRPEPDSETVPRDVLDMFK